MTYLYFSILGDAYEGCTDIDECQSSTDLCTARELDCVNTDGSFICDCIPDQQCKHINKEIPTYFKIMI